MGVTVTTPYLARFTMPGACIGCGDPAAPGAGHKARYSRSAGKLIATTSLDFPLCQACADASRDRPLGWVPIGLGFIFAIWPALAAVMVVLGSLFSMDLAGLVIGLVLGAFAAGIFLAGLWLKVRIDTWGMSPEQRQRRRTVDRSVTIAKLEPASIIFEFADPAYGTTFSSLNAGQLA